MSVNSHPGARAARRRRPVQARSKRTVEAILDAAAHIYGERGYAATTTNHVAEAAGVSIGSLYQYFPDKDALLVALEERHLALVEAELAGLAAGWRRDRPEPGPWVRSLVEVLVAANDSPLHLVMYDTAPPLPHLRRSADRVVEALVDEAAAHLRRWGHGPRAGLRARLVVATAVRAVHDLVVRVPAGPDRAEVGDELTRMLLAVVDPPAPPPSGDRDAPG